MGAASVGILMTSPLGKGLFQRAIAESGGMFEPMQLAPNYRLANAELHRTAGELAFENSTFDIHCARRPAPISGAMSQTPRLCS